MINTEVKATLRGLKAVKSREYEHCWDTNILVTKIKIYCSWWCNVFVYYNYYEYFYQIYLFNWYFHYNTAFYYTSATDAATTSSIRAVPSTVVTVFYLLFSVSDLIIKQ